MPYEFIFYPAREEDVVGTTATINPAEVQLRAAGLSANTPVRVTVRQGSSYIPVVVPVPPDGADVRAYSTDFHRAAQSAIRGKEDALRELGKW
ncbi:MAG: hypothetical protein GX131_19730 [candidate division WS1 bacterium]|jgi:hypothetical protein|nr:hypothetical protein [candidate division WS1 bacterium]